MAVWGPSPDALTWDRLDPAWLDRLQAALDSEAIENDAAQAREALRREHAAEVRPDPRHVHESWWIRALQGESPAVSRAVIAQTPPPIGPALQRHFQFSETDLETDRPAHPEALRWALTLWSERLVGGPDAGTNDQPVIVALTGLDRRDLRRLIVACGLAKLACQEREPAGLRGRDRERFNHFRERFSTNDPRLARLAWQDQDDRGKAPLRHDPARLGLSTIGRLLTRVEPYRARWALQHLPYPVARQTRVRLGRRDDETVSSADLIAWESTIFQAALERIEQEDAEATVEQD